MLGAVLGDVVGSIYERRASKQVNFPLFKSSSTFTANTVMLAAVADIIVHQKDLASTLRHYGLSYPNRGYGGAMAQWLLDEGTMPMNTTENGVAIRVIPVGFSFEKLEEALRFTKQLTLATHNHPESLKAAQAVTTAVFMARHNSSKDEIKKMIEKKIGYKLKLSIKELRPNYVHDTTCLASVPPSIQAFLESSSVESAIRLAISLAGDTDTMAGIAGGIAQAYYRKIPHSIITQIKTILPANLWNVIEKFSKTYKAYY